MMSDFSRRMRMRGAALLALATVLTATAACGSGSADSARPGGAQGGKPDVTAAMYPLQWLAERVGGPDVTVTGLTKPGVEPHDLELSPLQVAGLEETSLVAYIKGVQPAVDEAVEQHAAGRGFDAAAAVKTLPAVAGDEHAEEEAHPGEEEHGHDLAYDPHLWLDPSRFATVATQLGEKLAAVDPAHAQGYKDRAAKTAADLTALDGELARGLSACGSKAIVTSHTAFGYLADRYGLHQIGVSGLDPDAEPSPARLAEVAKVSKQEKVTTIFTETLVSPKVAEVLAQEVGAKTAVLDPVESQPAGGDYLSAMRQNLTALQAALNCP
ncbi:MULTISPECIES: metal ABC transporter substrate-binding protein [Streptosporangium]|uniref:Zinc transport system substrate-binding protein n=1 Tax=Streptosporangium brasiliense TaxID=47480 RepID=A0ABT9QWR3_9ACTN|nr:metal ABC transporter substrate-binding protein [Streptosporangium brasiliense]MDP9861433.1 zinc transport system substrate-binding protein [Streptosporangium brasiliense]